MAFNTKKRVKFRTELWVRPGEGQTVESLLEKFKGSILSVNDNGEILIALNEETREVGN